MKSNTRNEPGELQIPNNVEYDHTEYSQAPQHVDFD